MATPLVPRIFLGQTAGIKPLEYVVFLCYNNNRSEKSLLKLKECFMKKDKRSLATLFFVSVLGSLCAFLLYAIFAYNWIGSIIGWLGNNWFGVLVGIVVGFIAYYFLDMFFAFFGDTGDTINSRGAISAAFVGGALITFALIYLFILGGSSVFFAWFLGNWSGFILGLSGIIATLLFRDRNRKPAK